mmetsp:Transcript_25884/g.36265  ORF Transcript_25884/g.36265 Transcript_25884/m.36265 type:complete len:119 (+) Transcript_25884:358-714(+)
MAMTGENFCDSAKNGYNLIFKNFKIYFTVNALGHRYILFNMILIIVISSLCGNLLLENFSYVSFLLLVYVCIPVVQIFVSILSLSTDCILFYLVMDKQLNNNKMTRGPKVMLKLEEMA